MWVDRIVTAETSFLPADKPVTHDGMVLLPMRTGELVECQCVIPVLLTYAQTINPSTTFRKHKTPKCVCVGRSQCILNPTLLFAYTTIWTTMLNMALGEDVPCDVSASSETKVPWECYRPLNTLPLALQFTQTAFESVVFLRDASKTYDVMLQNFDVRGGCGNQQCLVELCQLSIRLEFRPVQITIYQTRMMRLNSKGVHRPHDISKLL
jgi:hypothetical protein